MWLLLLILIFHVAGSKLRNSNECVFSRLGTSYKGTVSVTVSGRICQRWDSQSPNKHNFTSSAIFPDHNLTIAANHCRNPTGERPNGPWCFTTDPEEMWEYCHIPACNCKSTNLGAEYMGDVNVTRFGRTCQRWDSQTPHNHPHVEPYMYPDDSVSSAENYCRNPNKAKPDGPWCHTTDPDIHWEYCDVDFCECKVENHGFFYQGQVSKTLAGLECQRWESQSPHSHSYTHDSMFPDESVSAAENFCRNPDGTEPNGPWCYTTDLAIHWQYCDVPLCEYNDTSSLTTPAPVVTENTGDSGCKIFLTGMTYLGNLSSTISGRTCQRWDAQFPHQHTHVEFASLRQDNTHHNFCRNPDMYRPYGPWCYTADPKVRWEYCDVPFCECTLTRSGEEYGGKQSKTASGRTCQRWDSQVPHRHHHDNICAFPDHDLGEAASMCRNPDPQRRPRGPWCYTTDPDVEWEYCNITECNFNDTHVQDLGSTEENVRTLSTEGIAAIVIAAVAVVAVVLGLVMWKLSLPTRTVLQSKTFTLAKHTNGGYDNPGFGAVAYTKEAQLNPLTLSDLIF